MDFRCKLRTNRVRMVPRISRAGRTDRAEMIACQAAIDFERSPSPRAFRASSSGFRNARCSWRCQLSAKWKNASVPNLSRMQRQAYNSFQQGNLDKAERLCAGILEYRRTISTHCNCSAFSTCSAVAWSRRCASCRRRSRSIPVLRMRCRISDSRFMRRDALRRRSQAIATLCDCAGPSGNPLQSRQRLSRTRPHR